MARSNTVAVLDGKGLEKTIERNFPHWRVIWLKGSANAHALIRTGSIGLFMADVHQSRPSDLPRFRSLVREVARHHVPALFVAESPQDYSAIRKVVAAAPPTVQAVFGRDELRPMVNIVRERLARVQGTSVPTRTDNPGTSSSSDLDRHPLVQQTTLFLRNPRTGRLDAKKIAEFYDEPLKRFAAALNVSASAVTQTPDSQRYQDFLSRFEKVARIVPMLESKDKFSAWVKAPNKELKGAPPIEWLWGSVIKARNLADIVEDVLVGQPD